jgi:hypothetical protein
MFIYRRRVAWTLLALFTAWQLGALLHVSLVPHSVGPHGHAVHHEDDTDHRDHDHRHTPCDSEDSACCDCQWILLLTSASTLVDDGSAPLLEAEISGTTERPQAGLFRPTGREIFRISPANSPPKAA